MLEADDIVRQQVQRHLKAVTLSGCRRLEKSREAGQTDGQMKGCEQRGAASHAEGGGRGSNHSAGNQTTIKQEKAKRQGQGWSPAPRPQEGTPQHHGQS